VCKPVILQTSTIKHTWLKHIKLTLAVNWFYLCWTSRILWAKQICINIFKMPFYTEKSEYKLNVPQPHKIHMLIILVFISIQGKLRRSTMERRWNEKRLAQNYMILKRLNSCMRHWTHSTVLWLWTLSKTESIYLYVFLKLSPPGTVS